MFLFGSNCLIFVLLSIYLAIKLGPNRRVFIRVGHLIPADSDSIPKSFYLKSMNKTYLVDHFIVYHCH
ncbi:hypothetical protein DERP_002806 [Dermatophagoides pteronyssinus]|uniref:Uncharacterized protein n=1 Tax=Dermatophagoides pteronyssinus TaxID=6956 RepID=A0ABQ8JVS2_DERPT|nr:hypothetical protein DERP_002806 [Dermatophagoides pteronyssinus]